ncbi:efflux RND transporter periplasmic adaptor subunit [Tunturiibacter lichenicola]|uniref:efflux RND transporter periplasmic adaptor subunit n=1 Tax=Tunturiibacter lichenicola TaxID=2051959 RepID=UPI0021B46BFE|nr:efflux RND transporter periplasmic adaptor subunit [Edaphobacter lichenicola]
MRRTEPLPGEPKGSPARKWIVALVIVAVVGAAVWKIRGNTKEQNNVQMMMAAQADRPTPVQVSAVQQKTMPIFLTALGTVTAYNTVTIKSRVDGQLMQVPVREGQAVKQGQMLAEIDPKPYQAALEQAQGQLLKDQANAVNARAEAARYTALLQAGVTSKESQQAQISTAGQAEGSVAADQAAIEAAKVNLGYTKILSPINGVVGLRQVDPGNIVHATDTNGLLVVTQLQPIAVIFTLPEDQLPEVLKRTRAGDKLVVEAYDRADATHLASGSLLTIDNQIDTTTGTVKAKAVFENRDGALFPNQFVNVRLILQEKKNAVVIPATALQTGTQGNFVYLLKQGEPPANLVEKKSDGPPMIELPENKTNYYVEAQTVNVELTEGTQVILNGGVKPGDQIVVDGQEKLKNGSKVFPRTAPAKAADKTTAELGMASEAAGRPS